MQPGLGEAVATFPASGDPDYATSGLAINVDTLAGTTAVVDEAVGAGRVVSFSVDPNFRAWSQGTQRILWNAIVGPEPAGFGHAALGRLQGPGGRREGGRWPPRIACPQLGLGHPDPRRRRGCGRDGEDPRPPRRRGRPDRCRRGRAVPRRQPRRPVVRGASVLRARRPRPREGGHHAPGGQPAVAPRQFGPRQADRSDPGRSGRWTGLTVVRYHPATCRVHTFYASPPHDRTSNRRPPRLDAQEIKTAVAHQDAATRRRRGAVRQSRRPGPRAGRRRPPGRQPPRPDLRGRARRAVERLALAALAPRQRPRGGRADPEPDRRGARRACPPPTSSASTSRPYFISLIDPDDPNDPIRRQVIPLGSRARGLHGDDGGLARRGPPLPGARASSIAIRTGS